MTSVGRAQRASRRSRVKSIRSRVRRAPDGRRSGGFGDHLGLDARLVAQVDQLLGHRRAVVDQVVADERASFSRLGPSPA